jgi:hypothetical protein
MIMSVIILVNTYCILIILWYFDTIQEIYTFIVSAYTINLMSIFCNYSGLSPINSGHCPL